MDVLKKVMNLIRGRNKRCHPSSNKVYLHQASLHVILIRGNQKQKKKAHRFRRLGEQKREKKKKKKTRRTNFFSKKDSCPSLKTSPFTISPLRFGSQPKAVVMAHTLDSPRKIRACVP